MKRLRAAIEAMSAAPEPLATRIWALLGKGLPSCWDSYRQPTRASRRGRRYIGRAIRLARRVT